MKQIHFYAAEEDILSVLDVVEKDDSLIYVLTGLFSTADYHAFARGAEIPGLGRANTDSSTTSNTFLVSKSNALVNVRPITGGSINRFAIDQLINPDTVIFTPGGLRGSDVVLSGRVATVSDSILAQEIMKRFQRAFKKHFVKIRAFWVGPKAQALFDAGKRLSPAVQCPVYLNLARDVVKTEPSE